MIQKTFPRIRLLKKVCSDGLSSGCGGAGAFAGRTKGKLKHAPPVFWRRYNRVGFEVLSRIVLVLGMAAAFGQAAEPDTTTYSRRLWRSADGLPEDFAQALAQTRDGYLWIGTSGGLVRFDGIRFTAFNRENSPAFQDDSFYSLLVSKDGTLWGGTEGGGLVRYKGGTFRVFGAADGLTNSFVRVIFEDREGNLWAGTDAGLFRMQNDSLTRIDGHDAHKAVG